MRRLLTAIILLLAGGCATIVKGTTQSISLNTPGAPGATCTLSSGGIGSKVVVTPAVLTVDKSQESINVQCRKECYQDAAAVIASNTETMAAGNVIAGGPIGLGIDAATGAMNKYTSQTDITMIPLPQCRGRV